MTELRRRMDDDRVVRGMADRTREAYLWAVSGLAKFYRRPPDQISDEHECLSKIRAAVAPRDCQETTLIETDGMTALNLLLGSVREANAMSRHRDRSRLSTALASASRPAARSKVGLPA